MKVLGFILQKEFRQIFRDKTILAMMFAVPIIQLIILPLAANFEVKNVNVVFVDYDRSTYSQKLLNKIASSGYFRIVGNTISYNDALHMIEKNETDIILEIPNGFERNLVREGSQQVHMSVDAINGTKSSIGSAYLSAVLVDFNRTLDVNTKAVNNSTAAPMPLIDITYTDWFNPRKEYKYYMVPGILVLLLTLIGGFITALNIVREKEIGTIEQINVTPIKKWQFILGKLIPFWIVGMIVFTLGLIVMYIVYGIFPAGSFAVLYLFAAVYLVALLGFGLLISTFSNSQLQAMFVAFFFMMIFMLMSGFFTSLDSMPGWAKQMSFLTPVTHFIAVVRLIVLKGSGLSEVRTELLYLLAFAIVLNGLAIYNYRKTN
ncbi:ABC transporter permease [Flavisolibacter tropicus]|uniref:ABC transporter permease n=1 Tax=Flavisolibacter tropicus TaxID=1492898 RepID=A0A172TXY4_9BACT|nr:ABC transporter permease [Flavisolibacter tropicus]ANE51945.1 ABC transporter permease [Flavisolibacter tropicus]